MPRQVARGVVIAPMARPTAVTPPTLGPPEVLDQAAAMAGPRAGKAPVGLHQLRAARGGPDARPRWWSRPPPAAGPGAADASRSTPSRSRSRSARRRAPPGPPRWRHAPPDDPGRDADPQRARERAVTPGRPPGSGDRLAGPGREACPSGASGRR